MVICVHHKANIDNAAYPANSLKAVQASLQAGAQYIEIDIVALADEDYLVTHDLELDHDTNGMGAVGALALQEASRLRFKGSDVRVPVLRDVVETVRGSSTRLQLDFKNIYPFSNDEPLQRLVNIIKPLDEQVIVSSGADWQLRKLRRLAPWLDIGFDIHFYLDWRDPDPRYPPYHQGAYGYLDDSLIGRAQFWPVADYLQDRCAVLARQVDSISRFYMSHRFLAKSLDDGFNWVEALQAYSIEVTAYTIDMSNIQAVANAKRLAKAGVMQFTSNTPLELARYLNE